MLEIKNLTKIYHSKNGNSVTALDNVSMSFPETGMVFVLGKSGSGKSTLLNVIGGLDGYDSGEFIIKGKSSKNFGGSDFDAYRNTFIGFIFQEYNILDDFSVGANIGLALELQGKKATSEVISDILAQVDMLDYAKRRPNELSGGQKQRIAIARALVKDPEIIMADEPTGALDSNTGKQIFDTLKELSKKKLVIVVSHDRDFAEKYGDRIIEMQDGKILSDITKHQVAAKSVSSGILQMNDSLLRIEKGYQLTAEDVRLINEYLKKQDADILISGDSRINEGVRSTAGISENNTSSVFKKTDEEADVKKKSYDKKDTKFIRSRLPMKNALKMGSSSLGHKKFRLVITILLSLVAFALFGFADTMGAYDKIIAATDSIIDSNVTNASYSLELKHTWVYPDSDDSHSYYSSTAMNEDDLKMLSEKTGMKFIPVFDGSNGDSWGGGAQISIEDSLADSSMVNHETAYTGAMYGFTAATANDLSSLNFNITGKMPEKDDQIVISEFLCREINLMGFENKAMKEKIIAGELVIDESGSKNSIIGKHLTVNYRGYQYTFEIVGVIDTRFDYDRYSAYVPTDSQYQLEISNQLMHMIMQQELSNTLKYGFHGLGYITQSRLDAMSSDMKNNMNSNSFIGIRTDGWNLTFNKPINNMGGGAAFGPDKKEIVYEGFVGGADIAYPSEQQMAYFNYIGRSSDIPALGDISWLDGTPRTTLAANEVLVCETIFDGQSIEADVSEKIDKILQDQYGKPLSSLKDQNYIGNVISELAYESYMDNEELFNTLKPELERLYRESRGLNNKEDFPVIEDKELRMYWRELTDTYGMELPNGIKNRDQITFEAYKSFCEAFFEKTYNEKYSLRFYEQLINNINSMGDGKYLLRVNEMQNILVAEYAYDTIYSNPEICNSEDFYNFVIADRGMDDWNMMENKEELSAQFYTEYIMNRIHKDEGYYGEKQYDDFSSDAKLEFTKLTGKSITDILEGAYLNNYTWNENGQVNEKLTDYVIVGTFASKNDNARNLIISDTLYDKYKVFMEEQNIATEIVVPHEAGIYAFAIAPMPKDEALIEKLVSLSYEDNDYSFRLQNQVMDTLGGFNEFIEIGAKVFLYIGIGFAVFAALMLMNFISVSISYKRREIGILRAVGARSSDVFKIFFCEAFIIALINYVLSMAATIGATILTNNIVRNEGINVTLLHFGVRQVILMFLISVAVAAIASFLPVWNIARRKPVDAIKNK